MMSVSRNISKAVGEYVAGIDVWLAPHAPCADPPTQIELPTRTFKLLFSTTSEADDWVSAIHTAFNPPVPASPNVLQVCLSRASPTVSHQHSWARYPSRMPVCDCSVGVLC